MGSFEKKKTLIFIIFSHIVINFIELITDITKWRT